MRQLPNTERCLTCKMEFHPEYRGTIFCDNKCAEHYFRREIRRKKRMETGYPQYDPDIDDLHVKMRL